MFENEYFILIYNYAMIPLLFNNERGFLYNFKGLFLLTGNMCFRIEVKHQIVAIILVCFPFSPLSELCLIVEFLFIGY